MQAQQKLITQIIIGIAILLVISGIILTIKNIQSEESSRLICRASVQENAALQGDVFMLSSEVKCPARTLIIKEDVEKDEYAVKEKIAKAMTECWEDYGKGEKKLFSDTGQQTFCTFCTIIRFEDKGKTITGMKTYLTEYPKAQNAQKYWDYLYPTFKIDEVLSDFDQFFAGLGIGSVGVGVENLEEFRQQMINLDVPIDTNKDLAIMYVHGQYTGYFLKRWFRNKLGLEGVIPDAAVAYINYDKESIENLRCTSFPIQQLKYVDFSEDPFK